MLVEVYYNRGSIHVGYHTELMHDLHTMIVSIPPGGMLFILLLLRVRVLYLFCKYYTLAYTMGKVGMYTNKMQVAPIMCYTYYVVYCM